MKPRPGSGTTPPQPAGTELLARLRQDLQARDNLVALYGPQKSSAPPPSRDHQRAPRSATTGKLPTKRSSTRPASEKPLRSGRSDQRHRRVRSAMANADPALLAARALSALNQERPTSSKAERQRRMATYSESAYSYTDSSTTSENETYGVQTVDFCVQAATGVPENVLALAELLRYETTTSFKTTDDYQWLNKKGGPQNPVFKDLFDSELDSLKAIYERFKSDSYFVGLAQDMLYTTDAWKAGFAHLRDVIYKDFFEAHEQMMQELSAAEKIVRGYEEATEALNTENTELSARVQALEAEKDCLQGVQGMTSFDLEKVQAEKTKAEGRVAELEAELATVYAHEESLQNEISILTAEIQDLHADISSKEQRIQKSVEKAREYKDQLDTYTREGQVSKLEDSIANLTARLNEKTAQYTEKSELLEKTERRVSKLLAQNQAMVTEREKFIYRLEHSMMRTEDKHCGSLRLNERLRRTQETLSNTTTELKETSEKLQRTQDLARELKRTLKSREDDIKGSRAEYNRMQDEYSRMHADFSFKESRIATLEQQLQLYQQELAATQDDMKKKAEMFESVATNSLENQNRIVTIEALKEKIELMERDRADMRAHMADLKEEITEARTERQDALTKKEQLVSQLAGMTEKLSQYELAAETQKKLLADTEEQRLEIHKAYLAVQNEMIAIKLDLETAQLRAQSHERSLEDVTQRLENTREELQFIRKENEELKMGRGTEDDAFYKLKQDFEVAMTKQQAQAQDLEDKQLRIQELIFQNDRMARFIEEVKENYRGQNILTLINENLRLKSDLDALLAARGSKAEQHRTLLTENANMKEQVAKLHLNTAESDARLGMAYQENESLRRKAFTLTKDNKDARDKLALLEGRVKSHEHKIESLKAELDKRNRLLAARDLEIGKLRALCVKLTKE